MLTTSNPALKRDRAEARPLSSTLALMLTPLISATGLALCLTVSIASAGDRGSKAHEACLARAASSDGMRKAEESGGKLSSEEYLIEQCGFNPTTTLKNGRSALNQKDCKFLYKWAQEGTCMGEQFATYQASYLKHLNPRVFQLDTYTHTCTYMNNQDTKVEYLEFWNRVCVAPLTLPSKKKQGAE